MTRRISRTERDAPSQDLAGEPLPVTEPPFDTTIECPDPHGLGGGCSSVHSGGDRAREFGGLFWVTSPLAASTFVVPDAARVRQLFLEWQQSSGVPRST